MSHFPAPYSATKGLARPSTRRFYFVNYEPPWDCQIRDVDPVTKLLRYRLRLSSERNLPLDQVYRYLPNLVRLAIDSRANLA